MYNVIINGGPARAKAITYGMHRKVVASFRMFVKDIQKDMKRRISIRGTGGARSLPGHAPFKQTGLLFRNIQTTCKRTVDGFEATIFVDPLAVTYAYYLEFGTSKMAPRPFFYNTIRAHVRRFARGGGASAKNLLVQSTDSVGL